MAMGSAATPPGRLHRGMFRSGACGQTQGDTRARSRTHSCRTTPEARALAVCSHPASPEAAYGVAIEGRSHRGSGSRRVGARCPGDPLCLGTRMRAGVPGSQTGRREQRGIVLGPRREPESTPLVRRDPRLPEPGGSAGVVALRLSILHPGSQQAIHPVGYAAQGVCVPSSGPVETTACGQVRELAGAPSLGPGRRRNDGQTPDNVPAGPFRGVPGRAIGRASLSGGIQSGHTASSLPQRCGLGRSNRRSSGNEVHPNSLSRHPVRSPFAFSLPSEGIRGQ
jgi:hypothetical protein